MVDYSGLEDRSPLLARPLFHSPSGCKQPFVYNLYPSQGLIGFVTRTTKDAMERLMIIAIIKHYTFNWKKNKAAVLAFLLQIEN